jgi:hypothetical protein
MSCNLTLWSRYIRTPILPLAVQQYLDNKGVGFALVEDCCQAMLLLATKKTINGKPAASLKDKPPFVDSGTHGLLQVVAWVWFLDNMQP